MHQIKIDYNLTPDQKDNAHGYHPKIGVVLHETVSAQVPNSLADIIAISRFVGTEGYGIHGITDADGHKAWAKGMGQAIFYHATSQGNKHYSMANSNYMGIEQISKVMLDYRTRVKRIQAWLAMDAELRATAKLIACAARAHGWPIVDNPGNTLLPGVTTHWEVSMYNGVQGGHTDCWPSHLGGYYPKREVIRLAKRYYSLGWHF